MKKKLTHINIKLVFIALTVAIVLFPIATKVHNFQTKYEPRSSLIHRDDIKTHHYALLGDSVFCSFYVNRDTDTIWNKFEKFTQSKMFPGALNGARRGDIVNAAKYVSQLLPAYATVFINIIPTSLIVIEKDQNNYDLKFADLFKKESFTAYKYISYFDVDYLRYASNVISGRKSDLQYDRRWNIDGDFALNRYRNFGNQINKTSRENLIFIKEVNVLFRNKNINVVFVLTPLNDKLIYAYSKEVEADRICKKLNELRSETLKYLNDINVKYIDLSDAVPDHCFADLVHTNACGDEIIAQSLADYVSKSNKHSPHD